MARPHERPARLNLQQSIHMQQPQALFSPALPTGIQSGFYPPPFPGGSNPLQTPMQPFFNQGPPHAPGRPGHQTRNSISHFPGQQQPNGFVTPITGHFPRPSVMLGPGQPFLNPNGLHRPHKRQMSIGGPPKAVLGGPARKVSPNPIAVAAAAAVSKKKITVNLPKETVETINAEGEEGGAETKPEPTRVEFARIPLPHDEYTDVEVQSPELVTRETFPPEDFAKAWPEDIDVFLPRKETWDILKQQVIEAKLEKLGVERGSGSGSNIPHIFAPHARAASISSPADPALLLFKLNKLQASQQASANNSLAASPQPPNQPFGLSPSPHQRRPSPGNLFQPRHGHTMSLAQPPSFVSPGSYDTLTSFNPFASTNGSLDVDRPKSAVSDAGLHSLQSDLKSSPIPRLDSRPDFIRGFGLDIPEEDEPEEEEEEDKVSIGNDSDQDEGHRGDTEQEVADGEEGNDMELDGVTTGSQSLLHSRHGSRQHISRVSAALSLKSVGGNNGAIEPHPEGYVPPEIEVPSDYEDVAAVQEWTGSEEEGYMGADTSDDESLGEFSNPSDEERARRQRVEKRMRRRVARDRTEEVLDLQDHPRRIPNFPRPPEGLDLVYVPTQRGDLPDDIISNPSEEDLNAMYRNPHHPHLVGYRNGASGDFYVPRSNGALSPRLPPLPHSRASSQQYSIHDPAMAHSRNPSQVSYYPSQNPLLQQHSPQNSLSLSASGKKDTLNPFAKPFVFGKPLPQEQSKPATLDTIGSSSRLGHARADSTGKPLNVAAPEFKPRGLPTSAEFTFRQPDAPPMPVPIGFPQPELVVPHHQRNASVEDSPAFRTQGREKRPRLEAADKEEAVEDEGESMTSFRFPPAAESPVRKHRNSDSGSRPFVHRPTNSRAPFSFEAFSGVAHFPTIRPTVAEPEGEASMELDEEEDEAEATKENIPPPPPPKDVIEFEEDERQEFNFPPASGGKPKRAPLPLDFKNKTVPAGLFKALVNNNGEDRTRRGVRSRLGSREIFEHINRPSMDDSHVQMISRGHRMVTDPIRRSSSAGDDDIFSSGLRHERRRSSLPDALRDDLSAPLSPISSIGPGPQDLTSRLEAQHISDTIAQMLDVKFTALRRELLAITRESHANISQSTLNPASEAMIVDVVSLFRTQLEESAAKSMEDAQMEARGEMDFQMIRDLIEEGNKEILGVVRREVHELLSFRQEGHRTPPDSRLVVKEVVAPIVESVGDKTTRAVVEAISELSTRQDAMNCATPARERDLLLNDIVTVLTPVLNGLRPEPIDHEFLTTQLAQAVKPHISQLIDLASDKRETATIIVEQLLPLLPSLKGETEAMSVHLINEVRRAIAPFDPFEIKEQVADLVVERIDSRLAVRDKAFNVDVINSKVTEGISGLVDNVKKVPGTLEALFAAQANLINEQQHRAEESHTQLQASVLAIRNQLASGVESLRISQNEAITRIQEIIASSSKSDSAALELKPLLEALVAENRVLSAQNADFLTRQKALTTTVNSLPEVLQSNIVNLQNGIAELIVSRDIPKRDLDDLRKLNSDYQIQLTKARAAHGQARVEKEIVGEKLAAVEAEREKLKKRIAELEEADKTKTSERSTLESRAAEMEESLSKALARLQEADVATHADKQRITELENASKDVATEYQSMKAKVQSLEMEVAIANRDKEAATVALEAMKMQHDVFVAEQRHWDDLRQAAEKIDILTQRIGQADNEELEELRRYREQTRPLEADHAALQKRLKELEAKAANNERLATTATQSLAQAQQRSSEWERRAREYEAELEITKTKFEQAEQTQSQLEADYSMLKIQFEEKEAEERLNQDREQKQHEHLKALEAKITRLQEELVKARTARPPPSRLSSYTSANSSSPSPYRTNGNNSQLPTRPDSRASVSTVNTVSMANGNSSLAADRKMSSYTPSNNGAQPSVWDSRHAPTDVNKYSNGGVGASIHAPKSRYPHLTPSTPKNRPGYSSHFSRANAPSPSPSIVSAAPTLGDDGWYT